jgi:hypothetical protein
VAVVSLVSLIMFFAVGGPFGTINDAGNGVLALLCCGLALVLHRPGRVAATIVAIAGTATCMLGSFLVMSETTGFFLAGLVSSFGFALIGVWLVLVSRSEGFSGPRLAFCAGAVMALGLVTIPGILQGLDDQDAAPAWLLGAGVSWAGTYVLLPLWAFRFARMPARRVSSAGP